MSGALDTQSSYEQHYQKWCQGLEVDDTWLDMQIKALDLISMFN